MLHIFGWKSDSLERLGKRFGSDKYQHGFLPFYDGFFSSIREKPLKILEIGILKGRSLRMWAEYFKEAEILGADVDENTFIVAPRITCVRLDQGAPDSLRHLAEGHPSGFDIIIDDGSHIVSHQQLTLGKLFPVLKPGGFYVVEDLHTSAGNSEKCFQIYGLDRSMNNSTYQILKNCAGGGRFCSPYLEGEENGYVADRLQSVDIFESKKWSITAVLKKRGE